MGTGIKAKNCSRAVSQGGEGKQASGENVERMVYATDLLARLLQPDDVVLDHIG